MSMLLPLDPLDFLFGLEISGERQARHLQSERAEELNPRGPLYGKLQHGEQITLADDRVITPDMVLGEARQGRSVVYCLDTQFSNDRFQPPTSARLSSMKQHLGRTPSIWRARASIRQWRMPRASPSGAELLIATHFSSRYDGRQVVQIGDEARDFEKITVGRT
jgi:ribonuclease Z